MIRPYMRDVVDALSSFPGRGACTDAERRAALWVHDDLRARRYDAWVETVWVRPQWALVLLLHAAAGVAVSLTATALALPAAIAALAVAASYVLGALARLFYRRATQLVVVEPAPHAQISLWLVAHTDAPRCGAAFRERWRRWAARVHPSWLLVGGLLAVAALAGVRALGVEGEWLGAVQIVPTIVLLGVAAVALDVLLSPWSPGASDGASGVAVALALHEELTQRPPQRLAVGLILAGAGEAYGFAFRAWRRSERPVPDDTVIVEIGPCGSGSPAWSARHPLLVEACAGTRQLRAARPTAAGRPLPSLYVRGVGPGGVPPRVRTPHDTAAAVDEGALEATYDFVLDAVDRLDTALVRSSATSSGSSRSSQAHR